MTTKKIVRVVINNEAIVVEIKLHPKTKINLYWRSDQITWLVKASHVFVCVDINNLILCC